MYSVSRIVPLASRPLLGLPLACRVFLIKKPYSFKSTPTQPGRVTNPTQGHPAPWPPWDAPHVRQSAVPGPLTRIRAYPPWKSDLSKLAASRRRLYTWVIGPLPRLCRGLCRGYGEGMARRCRGLAGAMPGLCAEAMPRLCRGYAKRLCRGYAEAMPGLCRGYAEAMPRLCRGYAEALPRLWRGYAEAMPRLCRGYAEALPRL